MGALETVRWILCGAVIAAANYSDIKSYKIKNRLVLAALSTGLLLTAVFDRENFLLYLGGAALPLILFPLFVAGMLGAGDIKLLCGLGSLLGFEGAGKLLIFTFVSGGVIALTVMFLRKNGIMRFKMFFTYLKTCFITGKLEKYNPAGGRFRFSFCITSGFTVYIVESLVKIF